MGRRWWRCFQESGKTEIQAAVLLDSKEKERVWFEEKRLQFTLRRNSHEKYGYEMVNSAGVQKIHRRGEDGAAIAGRETTIKARKRAYAAHEVYC
jgi:hypothetical protein